MAEEVKKTSGRPKKVEEVAETTTNSNDAVMEMLKQMQSELAKLKEENKALKTHGKVETEETLTSDTDIEVMSLFAGTLNLYTEGFGIGTPYKFEDGYGSIIDIPLGDLKLIVKNNNKIAKDGYFYIMNEDAVAICRLKKAYERLLSAEKMEELTRATDEQIITLYKSAPSTQKELIIEYFAGRKANGEDVSHNVLYQLGELSGKKLTD